MGQRQGPTLWTALQAETRPETTVAVDFFGSQVQFIDHLRPIWDALPEQYRGKFHTAIPPYRQVYNRGRASRSTLPDLVCVSAIGDLKKVSVRRNPVRIEGSLVRYQPLAPTVLFEHGAGFSFHGSGHNNGSYAGGSERNSALCLPATNSYVQSANQKAYPHIPSPIVGCPKLDRLVKIPHPKNDRPVVCVSFHWDCKVCPETRWAFSWYGSALRQLSQHPQFELVAHGHPRMRGFWEAWYRAQSIEFIPEFEDVVRRADIYVNDSSSTLYEFAATGRPVVTLNAPWYRRDVNHGLRFWEHADVGIQVDHPDDLETAILKTIAHPDRAARDVAVEAVYPHLGQSAARAATVLLNLLDPSTIKAPAVVGP